MNTEKQMTPMAELIAMLEKELKQDDGDPWYHGMIASLEYAKSLLPKEKQGIIDAHQDAVNRYSEHLEEGDENAGEEFFNETYTQ